VKKSLSMYLQHSSISLFN